MIDYDLDTFVPDNEIGRGRDSVVYAVDASTVIRLFRERRKLRKEIAINVDIGLEGIFVPELEREVELYFPEQHPLYNNGYKQYGLIMRRIYGKRPSDLPTERERTRALGQHVEALAQIMRIGYIPFEFGLNANELFNQKRQELFIFDFARWKRMNEGVPLEIRSAIMANPFEVVSKEKLARFGV